MNISVDFEHLKNTYFAMRHGQSIANVEGKIVSSPSVGLSSYGLSATGREQVMRSAADFAARQSDSSQIRIISSDFLRARQTAEILSKSIGCKTTLEYVAELRERYFGEFDGQSDNNYPGVWELDAVNPNHQEHNVESVNSVRERVERLIGKLENQHSEQQFILVAHGDILQITQTLFTDLPAEQHRQLPHLDVAEIRKLKD